MCDSPQIKIDCVVPASRICIYLERFALDNEVDGRIYVNLLKLMTCNILLLLLYEFGRDSIMLPTTGRLKFLLWSEPSPSDCIVCLWLIVEKKIQFLGWKVFIYFQIKWHSVMILQSSLQLLSYKCKWVYRYSILICSYSRQSMDMQKQTNLLTGYIFSNFFNLQTNKINCRVSLLQRIINKHL